MAKKKKKKRLRLFYPIYFTLLIAAVAVIALACARLRPYLADYATDGSPYPHQGRNATPGIIAMNAAATQVLDHDDPLMVPFVKDLAALSVPYRFWRYYDGMLYIIGLLATAGKIEF